MSDMPVDVLVVSLGSTRGLIASDEALCESMRRAGASVEMALARQPPEVRTLALTDLVWALCARRAAQQAIARTRPRAVVYSSVTAALLWPRQGAIRFDALATSNRPGRHGVWQRILERRKLDAAPLLLPCANGSLEGLPASIDGDAKAVVLPIPVQASGSPPATRDIAAITYAANPSKKGLDRVLEAWSRVHEPGEQLLVAGTSRTQLARAGIELPAEGVTVTGMVEPKEYRTLLRRARAYVCAPRFEDYGIAQLEALADGCMLVTTPSRGPYAALPLAQDLDERLVSEDLGTALRASLDDPRPDYRLRAQELVAPWRPEVIDRLVAEVVLPRLLR